SSDFTALKEFTARRRTVAIVLLRLGAYAVGVAVDGKLEVTKSDTRYVKGRHRAGGQSQRRFERNREKWIRELFDKACRDAKERFAPFSNSIDHLALGGDRQVLNSFMKRCDALSPLQDRLLPGRVAVDRPNTGALEAAARDLWSWRVYRAPTSIASGK
ncbi:MAG: Vms1/Ankzf1 family peptidyl-tRNA hydrolase, partial [Candidatus Krumholzibacteria bacterium]